MIQSSVNHKKALRYKPDNDFERNVAQSIEGVNCAITMMLLLGHRPGTARLENVTADVVKDPLSKRDYTPDLKCVRCGQKFEAKWKSRDGSYSVGPDLLPRYAADNAILIFTTPQKVVAVAAQELLKKQSLAKYKTNPWKEPYLDFAGVDILVLLELKRLQACSYRGI